VTVKKLTAFIVLAFCFSLSANADIWKWVDAHGETHFVDTVMPIYTWLDEYGKVHYSDKPEHENAVAVQLVWHSTESLEEAGLVASERAKGSESNIDPNETESQRLERESAEAYYCKRATEIYESYVNAPQLYKTNADGQKEYLSEAAAAATLAETEARVDELCN